MLRIVNKDRLEGIICIRMEIWFRSLSRSLAKCRVCSFLTVTPSKFQECRKRSPPVTTACVVINHSHTFSYDIWDAVACVRQHCCLVTYDALCFGKKVTETETKIAVRKREPESQKAVRIKPIMCTFSGKKRLKRESV